TLCRVLIAVGLLVRYRKYIDWPRTGKELISKRTPIQLSREPETTPAAPQPTHAPAPPSAQPAKPPQPPAPSGAPDHLTIRQFGQVVVTPDRPYEITGDRLVFEKRLAKGHPH